MARFLAATALLVGLLIVFFVVLDYLEYIDDFIDRGATMREVFGTYYLNYIPEIVRLTSPLAIFLAAIYVTGRLAQSMQLVALLASGVSLVRIMVPFVFVGLLLTGFMFWFNGWIVPRTNGVVIEFQNQYYKKAPARSETSQIHRQNRPGSILSVGFFDRRTEQAYRVSLQDFEDADGAPGAERLARRLDAESMVWVDSLGVWRMRGVTARTFGGAGFGADSVAAYEKVPELDTTLQVLPRDLARTERDAERLTIPETRDYLNALRRAGADQLGRPLVGYYGKFSYPIANLILVVIGVAMASVRRRGGQAVQFGTGLFIAFVYLALQKLSEPFGYAEAVPPILVAWVPHALFAVFAVALVWQVRR
ncbi:MAG: LptF/LptG family permease [Bacteroidota bacterium]